PLSGHGLQFETDTFRPVAEWARSKVHRCPVCGARFVPVRRNVGPTARGPAQVRRNGRVQQHTEPEARWFPRGSLAKTSALAKLAGGQHDPRLIRAAAEEERVQC